jgi:HAD superfamily hydrolase (TIGR01549 family)
MMMSDQINVILFDMGGTLRSSKRVVPTSDGVAIRKISELIGAKIPLDELVRLLSRRAEVYSRRARETLIEVTERELWTHWMLPDWPPEQIAPIATQLNQLWRSTNGVRILFPDTREVLVELFRRGYRLGIVSNTVSSIEVPHALEVMELTGCFEAVILSCEVGIRKPDPAIMLEATNRMGVKPDQCAYVGDRIQRDVISSRKAGISKVILMRNTEPLDEQENEILKDGPDIYIDCIKELLDIFPPLRKNKTNKSATRVSLSTMWAIKNFPNLSDFFEAAERIGFAAFELNHQIDSVMLAGNHLNRYVFSSVHEPCPSDISTELLKDRDWLISSGNEEKRKRGVEVIKRSIDLAHQLGARIVVSHAGIVPGITDNENQLRKMYQSGLMETDEYKQVKKSMIDSRASLAKLHFEAVKKSLKELLAYAGKYNISLGIENRYHYFEIPSIDEMGELLNMGTPDQIGFIYDVGHAVVMERLGFFLHEEWLRRYAERMLECHLHDVRGIVDHFAPGLGEVDFKMVASYLPENIYRVFEVQNWNTYQQLKDGLVYLDEKGAI